MSGFHRTASGLLVGLFFTLAGPARAAVTLSADGPGDTYELIERLGFGEEVPDCGHKDFGRHIAEVWDDTLKSPVFVFHIHVTPDDDRCGAKDRQRNEIKAYNDSPEALKAKEGATLTYRWKFRLDEGFRPSRNFTHIFQIKASGGDEAGAPLLTLTPRYGTPNELQLIHESDEEGRSLRYVATAPLAEVAGQWIEACVKATHADHGKIEVSLTRLSDAKTILTWSASDVDLWRKGAGFNRPKWGIYRSLKSKDLLRDEQVRFNDFCVAAGDETCPSAVAAAALSAPSPSPTPRRRGTSPGVPEAHLDYAPGKAPRFWSVATADTIMARYPDYREAYWKPWSYVQGYMFLGFEMVARATGDQKYRDFIRRYIDNFVDEKGEFHGDRLTNLDNLMTGNAIVGLYEATHDERYKTAAATFRKVFDSYPRSQDGQFWHGTGAPNMWVDGIFMGQMFLLRYGQSVGDTEYCYNEAVKQLTVFAKHCRKGDTGLYLHAWSEKPEATRWADPKTGLSPEVWSEGLGWYALVLSETLSLLPKDHTRRPEVEDIFVRLAAGLKRTQDPKTGGWFMIVDKGDQPDNWIDTSGSAMFIYAIQRGIELGLLKKKEYAPVVARGYQSIVANAKINERGLVDIYEAGDGITIKKDYATYVSVPKVLNAKEAVAGFLWATAIVERPELEKLRKH